MIYINGQQINSIGGLSSRCQSVLTMIPGALKWISWCMVSPSVTTIDPANENQLLNLIQQGLSGEPYIRFNTFRASINKILSMSDTDVDQLAAIQRTSNDNEANLAVLLQQNKIFSYGDINGITDMIAPLITSRPDLFQALSFEDALLLTSFSKSQQNVDTELQTQSTTFALTNAATVTDFVNLSLFYQVAHQNQISGNLISQTQNSAIQAIYVQLQEVIMPYLFTPSTDMAASNVTLMQAIPELASQNAFIGYASASSGVLNLVRNIEVSDLPDPNLSAKISSYLTSVKNLIATTASPSHELSQNGRLATLTFQSDQSVVSVGVDREGLVFLLPDTKIIAN